MYLSSRNVSCVLLMQYKTKSAAVKALGLEYNNDEARTKNSYLKYLEEPTPHHRDVRPSSAQDPIGMMLMSHDPMSDPTA